MMLVQKNPAPPASAPPTGRQTAAEPFEVDLREALASTRVDELSFKEFQQALAQRACARPQ